MIDKSINDVYSAIISSHEETEKNRKKNANLTEKDYLIMALQAMIKAYSLQDGSGDKTAKRNPFLPPVYPMGA